MLSPRIGGSLCHCYVWGDRAFSVSGSGLKGGLAMEAPWFGTSIEAIQLYESLMYVASDLDVDVVPLQGIKKRSIKGDQT